jgi:hypothetical protein
MRSNQFWIVFTKCCNKKPICMKRLSGSRRRDIYAVLCARV